MVVAAVSIVGRVEEHRPPGFAACACGERVRGERAERLHVVRARWKQRGDHGAGRLPFGQCAERLTAFIEADRVRRVDDDLALEQARVLAGSAP